MLIFSVLNAPMCFCITKQHQMILKRTFRSAARESVSVPVSVPFFHIHGHAAIKADSNTNRLTQRKID